jgi:hypothetical protein
LVYGVARLPSVASRAEIFTVTVALMHNFAVAMLTRNGSITTAYKYIMDMEYCDESQAMEVEDNSAGEGDAVSSLWSGSWPESKAPIALK